ncbi:hypothetical protein ACNSOL_00115 [Aliarcobacter lanthieri]|uniref:hypothetical protein n=1 Tax=Aliarcobacter lanthieri TaxID=1355374 RepID=UPI003AB09A6C
MTKEQKLQKIEDYKLHLHKESINPIGILSNLDFCKITGTNSVGHYQYDDYGQYFTYREVLNVNKLQKIDLLTFVNRLDVLLKDLMELETIEIELKEQIYYLYFTKIDKDKKIYFNRTNKSLFKLLMDFYSYAKDKSNLKKAS